MGSVVGSGWVLRVGLVRAVSRAVVAAVAAAAVVVLGSSVARAAAPEFLAADSGSNLAAVRLLAVGEGQTKVGPPVLAYDSDGDTLTYSLSDGAPLHASFFEIDSSSGQISLKSNTRSGVYRVRVSAADGADTATVEVTIHVTSPGHYPWEDAWVEARSVTADDDGTANDWFGVSVDADDEVIVVGAPWADSSTVTGSGDGAGSGAVYVFDADSGAQLARLDSPVTTGGGWFGWNVELVGDAIFVSAPRETVSSVSSAGRVYMFAKPDGGWADTSTATATFEPGPTSAPMANQVNKFLAGTGLGPVEFGSGLAVSNDGNTLVVGAEEWENVPTLPMGASHGDSNLVHLYYNGGNGLDRDGALFVFTKPATGWADINTDASGVVRLYAGSREWRFAQLGKTIAISDNGGTIAASAMGAEQAEGWVYIFTKPETGWTNTTSTDTPVRLSVTGRHRNQRLGSKGLGISGDGSTVVAGAAVAWRKGAADDSQIPDGSVGAAFVFARPSGGWEDATQTAKLTTFGHKYDGFGGGVAISDSGTKIAVTNSDSRSSNFRGSAYVYTQPSGGWVDDTDGLGDNVRVLTAADADTNADHRYGFGGRGLAFVGEDALVVGQLAQIWALHKRDGVSSPPAGWTVYGSNTDHNDRANVPQGSAYLFKLRTAQQQPVAPPPAPPPSPPDDPEPPEPPEPPPPPPAPEFADVDEGSVHAESIEEVAALGITSGTTATMFSPSESVSRAQMASFVARTWEAAGRECPSSGASYFDDLPAGSTHAAGIDCVSALGIASGTAERMFSPSAPVSRGQMASFLANAWRQAGRTCPASDASSIFDDVAAGSTHAESIGCIAALGITRGTAAGMFSPSESVTRAQMATFLARFYEELTDTA